MRKGKSEISEILKRLVPQAEGKKSEKKKKKRNSPSQVSAKKQCREGWGIIYNIII